MKTKIENVIEETILENQMISCDFILDKNHYRLLPYDCTSNLLGLGIGKYRITLIIERISSEKQ